MRTTSLWATPRDGHWPPTGEDPTIALEHDLPGPGESRFLVVEFPPDTVFARPEFDGEAAAAEQRRVSPDLAALFEPDKPGMHTTDTVDYVIVLAGPIDLELDDGAWTSLDTGDIVVQNATRHGWRNSGEHNAVLAVVHLGPPAEADTA